MGDEDCITQLVEVSRRVRLLCAQGKYIFNKGDFEPDQKSGRVVVHFEDIKFIAAAGCAVQVTQPGIKWRWAGYHEGILVGFAVEFRKIEETEFVYISNVSLLRSPDRIPHFEHVFNEVRKWL